MIPNHVHDTPIAPCELRVFVEAMAACHGLDLRPYATPSLARRVHRLALRFAGGCMGELVKRVIGEPDFYPRLLAELTVTTTEMFRDPLAFRALVEHVFPSLAASPAIRIWHAGCSTGEEVYSLAILLEERGLYERSLIYATDLNPEALRQARAGVFSLTHGRPAAENYRAAGGSHSFTSHFHVAGDSILVERSLKRNIVFSEHNLLRDEVFGEMQLILCRNTLIYFNLEGQRRALDVCFRSLSPQGCLCLGLRETLRPLPQRARFHEVRPGTRIFRMLATEA